MPNFERGIPQQESGLKSKEIRDNFNALDDRIGKLTPKVLETIGTIISVGAGLVYFGDNKFIDFPGGNIDLADSTNGVAQFVSPGFWREILVYVSSTSTKSFLFTNFLTSDSNLKFIASDAKIGSIGNGISIEFEETTDPDISVDIAGFEIIFSIPDAGTTTAKDFKTWFDNPALNPASGDLKQLIGEVNSLFLGNDGTGIINTMFPKTRLSGGFDIDTTQGATLGIVSGPEKENLAAIERPDFSRADFPNFPTDAIPIGVVVVQNNGNTAEIGSIGSFTQSSVFDMRGYLNLTRSELALNQHRALSVNEAHTGKITHEGLSGGSVTSIKHRVIKSKISNITSKTITVVSAELFGDIGAVSPSIPVRFIKSSDVLTAQEDSDLGIDVAHDAVIETRLLEEVLSSTTLRINADLDSPGDYNDGFVVRGNITEDKLAFEPAKSADFIAHTSATTSVHGIANINDLFLKSGDIADITTKNHDDLDGITSLTAHTQYPLKGSIEIISGLWTHSSDIRASGAPDIGTSGSRFGEGFFQNLDISVDIDIAGDILMDAGKTVDGVDISVHDHSGVGKGGTIVAGSISGLDTFIETEVEGSNYTITGTWIFNNDVTIDGTNGYLHAADSPDIGDNSNRFATGYFNNLNLTNNIIIGGTVDGVDISDFYNIIFGPPSVQPDGSSLGYFSGLFLVPPATWAGPPPTNIRDAIDRLVTALYNTPGSPPI